MNSYVRGSRRRDKKSDRTTLQRIRQYSFQSIANTTAHGYSRLAQSTTWFARSFWLLLICAAMVMFTCHIIALVTRYRQTPTSVTYMPNQPDFEQPDIYVCPLNPLARNKPIPMPHVQALENKLKREPNWANITRHDSFKRFTWRLFTQSINMSRLAREVCRDVMSIFGGRILYQGEMFPSKSAFHLFPHPDYLCCYRFIRWPKMINLTWPHDELMMEVFLDSQPLNKSSQRNGRLALTLNSDISGVRVIIVPQGHYPERTSPTVLASPGFETHITVSQRKVTRHPATFNCTSAPPVTPLLVNPNTGATEPFLATIDTCVAKKSMQRDITKYGCMRHRVHPFTEYQTVPFCYNHTHLISQKTPITVAMVEDMKRSDYYRSRETREILDLCAHMTHCTQTHYHAKSSVGLIPTDYDAFAGSGNWHLFTWRSMANAEIGNKSEVLSIFMRSYLRLVIRPSSHGYTYIAEELAYPISCLFGDIGGILGLYLGISILTLCELFEFIVTLIAMLCGNPCGVHRAT